MQYMLYDSESFAVVHILANAPLRVKPPMPAFPHATPRL